MEFNEFIPCVWNPMIFKDTLQVHFLIVLFSYKCNIIFYILNTGTVDSLLHARN